jgi:hypothetical protein
VLKLSSHASSDVLVSVAWKNKFQQVKQRLSKSANFFAKIAENCGLDIDP